MKDNLSRFFLIAFILMLPLAAKAQEATVSGVIKDSGNAPVAGAVIYYDGLNVSAVSDADGRYSIKAVPGKVLVVSVMGMKEQRVLISKQSRLDFTLQDDATLLEDVVVIGYGVQQREDVTGSIASVKADELKKSASNSVLDALEGRVAGLSISTQSGEPGAGYQIRVRGANSINASSEPLYIVDGVQMDLGTTDGSESDFSTSGTDPLGFLNPSDIQSVEVLKDASASAIYGARGANGVIIITTKSGIENGGRAAVTVDASVGISQAARRIEMLNGQEWVNYRFERADYGGKSSFDDGTGHPIDVSDRTWYNWQDLMFRNAVTQNYGVSVRSKVGSNTQLLMSLGYLNQQGLVLGNDYWRYTGRTKIDHNISRKVKVGMSFSYSQNVGEGAMTSTGGGTGYTSNGLIQLVYRERPIDIMTDNDDEYLSLVGFTTLTDLVNGKTQARKHTQRVVGNAYLDWKIIDGLTFSVSGSGTAVNSNLKEFFSKDSRWGRQREGVVNHKTVEQMNWNLSARLSYKKQFNKAHNLDAMLGAEMSDNIYDQMKLTAYNFTDESTTMYDIGKGKVQEAPNQYYYTVGRMSAFGRVNYNYKSRYYLSASLRADGSSRFSRGYRVGWFPSASIGWRASKEPFLKSQRWLSNMMLRLSAGASGNDRIPMYSNLAKMNVNYTSISGTEFMGMSSISAANPALKWETTYQYNAGLDLSLFKNRVSLTADVFYKDTRDMLYLSTLSSQAGFSQAWRNLGRVDNRGLELSLTTTNINRRSFMWTTSLSFDLMRNRVLNIGPKLSYSPDTNKGYFDTEITRIVVGEPIGVIYGYVADGNYQFEDFIIKQGETEITDYGEINATNWNTYTYTLKDGVAGIQGRTVLPGDRKYRNLNPEEDNEVTDEDRTVIGRPYPKFSAGMGNTFSWKGLELYIFIDGAYGRQMLNEFKMRSESGYTGATHQYNITKESYYGAWRTDNPSDTYSRLLNNTNTWCSSYYVEDASFLRLKKLSLSYNMPSKVCKAIKFRGLKFTLSMDNVATLTRYSGMDPSLSSQRTNFPAYDTMSYPMARTWTFGITANL